MYHMLTCKVCGRPAKVDLKLPPPTASAAITTGFYCEEHWPAAPEPLLSESAELARLRAALAGQTALLRKMEWSSKRRPQQPASTNVFLPACPVCGGFQEFGHEAKCLLKAALDTALATVPQP